MLARHCDAVVVRICEHDLEELDAAREERRNQLREAATDRELPYLEISSATRTGLQELVRLIQKTLSEIPPLKRDEHEPDEEFGGEGESV